MAWSAEEAAEIAHIGPGTPSGEVFRRYWLPVETSANLGGGRGGAFSGAQNPLRIRILGEDLVLYRDGSGKPGLLAEHCSHRGTSLYYGRVEDDGLRCLYHGWKYDRKGACLDTPAEPPDSNFRYTVRHPAYPCVEVAGLIFAYLGPPDREPSFPRYEELFRTDGVRTTGDAARISRWPWFAQALDNVLDVWHREVLHGWFKGVPPRAEIHWGKDGGSPTPIKFERTPWGACYVYLANAGKPGRYEYHETHAVWPCQRLAGGTGKAIRWGVPIDDHRSRWFAVSFRPFGPGEEAAVIRTPSSTQLSDGNGAVPDDWVEQVGHWWNLGHPWRQGQQWEDEIAMSSSCMPDRDGLPDSARWRLASSDQGVLLAREIWSEQVERVRRGLDPIGVTREPNDAHLIRVPALQCDVDFEEGMRLFNLTIDQRVTEMEERAPGHYAGVR